MRVLAYPKLKLSAAEQHELLADVMPWVQVVRVPNPLPAVPACRDPHDLPVLHLAVAGKAQALVSGRPRPAGDRRRPGHLSDPDCGRVLPAVPGVSRCDQHPAALLLSSSRRSRSTISRSTTP